MIRNELDHVNKLLKSEIENIKYQDLYLICKKYYTDGLDYKQCKDNVIKFYEKNNIILSKNDFEYIYKSFETIKKNNSQLEIINSLPISQSDIDVLLKIDDEDSKKIMLSLIFFVKLENYKKPNDLKTSWCNESLNKIFSISQVNKKNDDKLLILNNLFKNNFIDINRKVFDDIAIKVNHIDHLDDERFVIRDKNKIYQTFLYHLGEGNIEKCGICNNLFKNKNKKYNICNSCRRN